ncbi:MAG: hypothetical protein ACJA1A_002646 [Saprospiraceae bacterium]|jgi:hypothetical protein|tara:strand:+ start:2211 stop:2369 length:159 start_codon:yes stop_codon:yes gene_type:complete
MTRMFLIFSELKLSTTIGSQNFSIISEKIAVLKKVLALQYDELEIFVGEATT